MKKIFGRILLVLPAIALQAFWYCVLFGLLDALLNQQIWNIINLLLTVLAAVFVMGLVTKRYEGS